MGLSLKALTKQILTQWQLKYPEGKEVYQEALLVDKPERIHLVKFEGIAKKKIQISAIKTHGGTGPSGMDTTSWK